MSTITNARDGPEEAEIREIKQKIKKAINNNKTFLNFLKENKIYGRYIKNTVNNISKISYREDFILKSIEYFIPSSNIGVENVALNSPAEDGPQVFRGEILLTYYDQDHKEYTERSEFSFKINPMAQMQEDFVGGGMEGEASMNGEAAPTDENAENKLSEKFGIVWKCSIFVCLIAVIVFGVKKGRGKRSLDIDDEDI